VPFHNDPVGDPPVRQEPIGGLGVGPILAGCRNAVANPVGDHSQQMAKALCQAFVWIIAVLCLGRDPRLEAAFAIRD